MNTSTKVTRLTFALALARSTRGMLLLLAIFLLVSCQVGSLAQRGLTPTLFPDPFNGSIKVGDYSLAMACAGSGEPTIVLMGGFYDWNWSTKNLTDYKDISRVCLYYRADQSGIKLPKATTAQEQAKELHTLLEQAGLPGPYSGQPYVSSFIMLQYVQQYPGEVKGLVCVACLPPAFLGEPVRETKYGRGCHAGTDQPNPGEKRSLGWRVRGCLRDMASRPKGKQPAGAAGHQPGRSAPGILQEEGSAVTELDKLYDEAMWAGNQQGPRHPLARGWNAFQDNLRDSLTNAATKKAIQEVYGAVKP